MKFLTEITSFDHLFQKKNRRKAYRNTQLQGAVIGMFELKFSVTCVILNFVTFCSFSCLYLHYQMQPLPRFSSRLSCSKLAITW